MDCLKSIQKPIYYSTFYGPHSTVQLPSFSLKKHKEYPPDERNCTPTTPSLSADKTNLENIHHPSFFVDLLMKWYKREDSDKVENHYHCELHMVAPTAVMEVLKQTTSQEVAL